MFAAWGIYLCFVSAGGLAHWPVYGTYLDMQSDGFRSGHTYLPLSPAPELLQAADPYDRVNIRYWPLDLSYFGGKFYTYWGPVPALFQAVVKALLHITRTIGDQYIGLCSACLAALAGALLIARLARRLFPSISRPFVGLGVLAFACANPMLHNVTTAGTYISAILSAQAWLLVGVVAAFELVWSPDRGRTRRWQALQAGVCWALAMGSRVTVVPTIAFLIVTTALAHAWPSPRRWLSALVCALWLGVPVLLTGVALLAYNKLRFDNYLEFGLSLQLSGYPRLRFAGQYWLPNLYTYSLRPFVATCQFPFIYQVWWMRDGAFPKGFPLPSDYMIDEPVIGWLRAVPITWLAPFAFFFAPQRTGRGFRHGRAYLWCVSCFVALASLNGLTALGVYGATMRYLGDVTSGLVLLGLLGGFALLARLGARFPRSTGALFTVLASATIVMGLLIGYQGYNGHFHKFNPKLDEKLVGALSFCGKSTPAIPHFMP